MPVNTVPTSVQCAVLIPFDRNIFFAVLRVFDFCIGFNPVYALTMLVPKTLRVGNAFGIHGLIGFIIYKCLRCQIVGDRKNTIVHYSPRLIS